MNKYDEKIKRSVIECFSKGETVLQISKATGISRPTIYSWVKECENKSEHKVNMGDYRKLQSHCKKLENMITILKTCGCAVHEPLRKKYEVISDLSDKQAEVIIDGKFNGLTENLIPYTPDDHPRAGLRLGFKAAQITISAIRGEVATYCFPVSLTSAPTEALNQDKVSMGTISARKFSEQIELVYLQFATHLLAAMQAIDLAGKNDFSPFTQIIHSEIRKLSAFVEDDRVLDKEAEAVTEWLKTTSYFGE